MPQVLKEQVRARICAAALVVFAERGFTGASMNQIASQAEVATGNLYRYFPSKEELFAAVIRPEVARGLEVRLAQSVRALAHLAQGGEAAHAGEAGEALLRFWIEHRLAVVILLDRSAGTPYAAYGERFVARLLRLTLAQLRAARPGRRVPASVRLVLTHVFENTRRTIAAILAASDDERVIREGIAAFRAYQIPGLQGLARWLATAA